MLLEVYALGDSRFPSQWQASHEYILLVRRSQRESHTAYYKGKTNRCQGGSTLWLRMVKEDMDTNKHDTHTSFLSSLSKERKEGEDCFFSRKEIFLTWSSERSPQCGKSQSLTDDSHLQSQHSGDGDRTMGSRLALATWDPFSNRPISQSRNGEIQIQGW